MAKQKEEKTNVMRVLEQKGVAYTPHTYPTDGSIDGASVAGYLGQDPECVFKTLVARGASGGYYVFDIPVEDTLPLTGYIHGGCSPVGMKKQFPTVFHETAEILDTICVSAGKIGYQVEVNPADLMALVGAKTADLTV